MAVTSINNATIGVESPGMRAPSPNLMSSVLLGEGVSMGVDVLVGVGVDVGVGVGVGVSLSSPYLRRISEKRQTLPSVPLNTKFSFIETIKVLEESRYSNYSPDLSSSSFSIPPSFHIDIKACLPKWSTPSTMM